MNPVKILWSARGELPAGWQLSDHTHSFYHLFYVSSGKVSFFLNQQFYELTAGTCVLIPPDTLHGIPAEDHTLLDALEVKFTLADKNLETALGMRSPIIRDDNRHMEHTLQQIVYSWAISTPFYQDAACTLLSSLLLSIQLYDLTEGAAYSSYIDVSPYSELTRRVIAWLEENHTDTIHLCDLAAHIGCNKQYLCTAFKQDTGVTIVSYLNHIRIRHATFCFYYHNGAISVIAQHVGFTTIVHFNRVFKELVGVSPSVYRECFSLDDTTENHRLTKTYLSLYEELLGNKILPLSQSVEALRLLGDYARVH